MKLLKHLLALALTGAVVAGCFFMPGIMSRRGEPQDGLLSVYAGGSERFGATGTGQSTAEGMDPAETAAETAANTSAAEPYSMAFDWETVPVPLPLSEKGQVFDVWDSASDRGLALLQGDSGSLLQELARRTGITLSYRYVAEEAREEQFNLMIAAGDYPAVLTNGAAYYSGGDSGLLDDGVCIDLMPYLEKLAPNYYSAICADQEVFRAVTTLEGRCGAVYSLYETPWQSGAFYAIREDRLGDIGINLPTTYDELGAVLLAIQDIWKNDSTQWNRVWGRLLLPGDELPEVLLSGFGAAGGMYLENGAVCYGPMQEEYRDFLEWASEWYARDLLTILDEETDVLSGRTISDMPDYDYAPVACFPVSLDEAVRLEEQSGQTLAALPPLARELGGTVYYSGRAPSRVGDVSWSVTTSCGQPELLVRLIDYFYTPDGALLCNYGVEGETFVYGGDLRPQYTEAVLALGDSRTAWFCYGLSRTPTVEAYARGLTERQYGSLCEAWEQADVDYSRCIPESVRLTAEEQRDYQAVMRDVSLFVQERSRYYIETGDFTDYAVFLEVLTSLGVGECMELWQQAYERSLLDRET